MLAKFWFSEHSKETQFSPETGRKKEGMKEYK
jgi:hypothetical protein